MKNKNIEYQHDKIMELMLAPSPLERRLCACDCGIEFQPNRSDQVYLNSKHYDKAYHQDKRKLMHLSEKATNKILRKNNDILDRHFALRPENQAYYTTYFDVLKADGFDEAYFIGILQSHGSATKFLSYNYMVHTYGESNKLMIKIEKR